MATLLEPGHTLAAIRANRPLVHNITNFVAMDLAANLLLAAGASPAMAHAREEVESFVELAGALTVNIGTFSPAWMEAAELAAARAHALGRPWVLDPVGVGATAYRQANAQRLLAHKPAVIRGNASEILALAGSTDSGAKGVDSGVGAEAAAASAERLAATTGAVVVATGPTDLVTDGHRRATIANGNGMMPQITALGCALTALTGAALAVQPDPFVAAAHALAIMGVAGERAAHGAKGPGSLRVALLDELYNLRPDELDDEARIL